MLPLVHPEGGIVLKKSTVPAGAGTLFVRLPQRKSGVWASSDSSIGISKDLPLFIIMVSLEGNSIIKLIVKQKIDTCNPSARPDPGPLNLLLIIACQR